MKTVCGIDFGTQSAKIIVYDVDAKTVVGTSQVPIDMIAENDGTREQKAAWYDEALLKAFGALDAGLKKTIYAIGVSGHQHSLVPLDADGKAVYNVKLWCDTSTSEECAQITRLAGGEARIIEEAGLPMRPGYTAPKVLWLKNHKKAEFEKLAHILLPHDYINYLLTGRYTAETGDASGTALFDVRKRRWSDKIASLIDGKVTTCLPALLQDGQSAGTVSSKAAALYGLPEGAVVSQGGGDNMMSAIGAGAVEDGFLTMSLGTSGTLFGFSAKPVIDPTGDIASFCSSSGGWLPLLCTMNCTVATEEFRSLFSLGVKEFDEKGAASPIGAEGVVILPFFNGERTPNLPNGRASVNGITSANFKLENIARAALESAIFGMRGGLLGFTRLGYAAKEIRISGGGSKSALWRSIAANVMSLPVVVPKNSESAALGGALQALWCAELTAGKKARIEDITAEHVALDSAAAVKPSAESVAAYNGAYKVYEKYLAALSPLYG